MAIEKLSRKVLDKVWGSPHTQPWYANQEGSKIGEIWFGASDKIPLLVKLLFTSDNLSVQVHPRDEYAKKHHNSFGKTEMWYILRADADAKIAIGLKETITPERLREASLSGEIMDLLEWVPAHAGDTFFTPAGTIHALGGGLVVCEVQQFSDVTYRLYDYGRPRELHLDDSIAVSDLFPYDASKTPVDLGGGKELLAECEYFRTERWALKGALACAVPEKSTLYIALSGSGHFAGQTFEAGDAFEAEPGTEAFSVDAEDAVFLVTREP